MAEPINNTASLQLRFEALEDLQDVDAADGEQFNYTGFNVALTQLLPASTTPVSRVSYKTYEIGGGGTVDIDLTALASSQTAIDGTGKKVQALLVKSRAGNDMVTVAPGASDDYAPWGAGNEHDIYSSATVAGVAFAFQPEGLPDISGTDKMIRISGTPTELVDVALWLG
jgi:hypothetical protein